jgi:Cof subfamily protein (haloacid dehalogenase superfamily)
VAIRLIATDLDGTLLRTGGTLSPRTAAALRRAAAAGVPVVPVTARPLRWLDGQPFLRDATHVVLTNGAVVYDRRTAAVTARHALAPRTLATLCDRIAAAVPAAVFAVEIDDGLAMRHEPAYPLWSDLDLPGRAIAELAELVARPAAKLLVKAPGTDPDELVPRVVAAVGPAAEVSSWANGVVELAPPGVTKASGLAAVAAQRGVARSEVVAFGDMPNDLPMLAWAGHAVAVANAHPDVLAVADEVVPSNDDDGVAGWIMARWAAPPGVAGSGAEAAVSAAPAGPSAVPVARPAPEVPVPRPAPSVESGESATPAASATPSARASAASATEVAPAGPVVPVASAVPVERVPDAAGEAVG